MTQPNLNDLINMKGAGNAEKALRKSGNWDECAGLEYKKWAVVADVVIRQDDDYLCIVKARSKEDAEALAIKEMHSDFDVLEIEDITKVEEITT